MSKKGQKGGKKSGSTKDRRWLEKDGGSEMDAFVSAPVTCTPPASSSAEDVAPAVSAPPSTAEVPKPVPPAAIAPTQPTSVEPSPPPEAPLEEAQPSPEIPVLEQRQPSPQPPPVQLPTANKTVVNKVSSPIISAELLNN